jgi:signal transduction histidine kinase
MTAAEETIRVAWKLRDQARSVRSQAQHIRAHTHALVEAAVIAEDRVAAVLGRLAEQRPDRAEQLLGMSESARRHAAGTRRRLAHHPGGGTCRSCRDQAPAASYPAPGPGGTPEAAAVIRTPERAGDLSVIGERDRIAARLQDTVVRRVFAAGLGLHSAAGLTSDPEVRWRIEAAVGELDQVIREIRDTLFQAAQQRHDRSLSQDILGLSRQLATSASVSFSGPVGSAAHIGGNARLLMILRQLLALIGEHATPTSIEIAAESSSYSLTIDAATLSPGAAAGKPVRWVSGIQAAAAQTGVSVAIQPMSGGTRITCQLPMAPPLRSPN